MDRIAMDEEDTKIEDALAIMNGTFDADGSAYRANGVYKACAGEPEENWFPTLEGQNGPPWRTNTDYEKG